MSDEIYLQLLTSSVYEVENSLSCDPYMRYGKQENETLIISNNEHHLTDDVLA